MCGGILLPSAIEVNVDSCGKSAPRTSEFQNARYSPPGPPDGRIRMVGGWEGGSYIDGRAQCRVRLAGRIWPLGLADSQRSASSFRTRNERESLRRESVCGGESGSPFPPARRCVASAL